MSLALHRLKDAMHIPWGPLIATMIPGSRPIRDLIVRSLEDWCWSSITLATWCEELTLWKRPWCWERLKAGGEGDDRGWDGWMASPTQWRWVWINSGNWWWTGRPGVLWSMGLQRIGHDWVTELTTNTAHYPSSLRGRHNCYGRSLGKFSSVTYYALVRPCNTFFFFFWGSWQDWCYDTFSICPVRKGWHILRGSRMLKSWRSPIEGERRPV